MDSYCLANSYDRAVMDVIVSSAQVSPINESGAIAHKPSLAQNPHLIRTQNH